MGLVSEYTTVGLNSSVISYYENLGYEIPRRKDKQGRLSVPQGATIEVKISDLTPSSNQYVEVRCDCDTCNRTKRIMYSKYNKNINSNNGLYLCTADSKHRDFLNGVSYESIIDCIKNFYNRTGKFPKYNEYTEENGIPFSCSKIREFLKNCGTTLNDELAKIDCHSMRKVNVKYYDEYLQRLKDIIKDNPQVGNDLYSLSRDEASVFGLPNIRWFIEHCPDKSVNNINTFKEWAGLYTKHMSKEKCIEVILDMAKKFDRPLMYDDFRGREYGQVTIQMIRDHWGSLNKMKQALGLEINQESMMDRQLSSKEELDNMVINICNFIHNENRDFITTREINANPNWISADSLQKTAKKIYNCKLQDLLKKYNVSLGKQGCGINFDFEDGEHITSQFEYMFSKFLRDFGLKYNVDYFRDVKYSTFIPEYKNNMNCDYVIRIDGKIIYIEIAGILAEYKTWFYTDKPISRSKSKEKYRLKLKKKEEMLKSHDLVYFILFPCDLTKDNFKNILENGSLELKKTIEKFNQNNIDWVKIREIGELDYSKPFLRDTRPKKEAV